MAASDRLDCPPCLPRPQTNADRQRCASGRSIRPAPPLTRIRPRLPCAAGACMARRFRKPASTTTARCDLCAPHGMTVLARAFQQRERVRHQGHVALRRGAERNLLQLKIDGVVAQARVCHSGDGIMVTLADGMAGTVKIPHPLCGKGGAAAATGSVTAPILGRVVRVLVSPCQAVARGKPLVVFQAIKIELRPRQAVRRRGPAAERRGG